MARTLLGALFNRTPAPATTQTPVPFTSRAQTYAGAGTVRYAW